MASPDDVERYPLTVAEPQAALAEHSDGRRDTNLMKLAWSSRWLILMCMLIGAGSAWVALQRVTPHYLARSRVYIDRNLPHLLRDEIQGAQAASYLFTQAELVKSTPVLMAVADAPENANLSCFRDVDNRVRFLKEEMSVSVGVKDEIIDVRIELPVSQDAVQLVNSCVEKYISKYAENRKTSAVEMLMVLRDQKTEQDEDLEKCRQALMEFRKQNPDLAVQVNQDNNVVTEQLAGLMQSLSLAETQLLEARTRYNRVKATYDTPSKRMYLLEEASKDRIGMRDVELERLVNASHQLLAAELAEWDEGHPRVKSLRQQYERYQTQLNRQRQEIIEAYVEGLLQNYLVADDKVKHLRQQYNDQLVKAKDVSTKQLMLTELELSRERIEKYCDILEESIKELKLTEDVGAINVNILEPAMLSTLPSYPIPSRFLAGGILLGGMLGFGLAWLRELLDHRLRSVDEIAAALQLPVLGALPHFGDQQDKSQAGRLVALTPRSPAAEAFRTLRTALHFGLAGRDVKTIVVTSPSPGDGKSTVASNLAIALAQADQRVLLIDADLRKPRQHQIFEVSPALGLGTVLTDRRPVEEAIIPGVADSLDLLPCGTLPANPVELLNNGFFADMLNQLRERYDRIVIDSPPVMPVADARVIAALGESTLLVLRAERSTRRLAQSARNELWRVRATRIGVVVNGVPQRKRGTYGNSYGYGYGYGYGEYGYMSYGYGDDDSGQTSRSAKKQKAALAKPANEALGTVVDSA